MCLAHMVLVQDVWGWAFGSAEEAMPWAQLALLGSFLVLLPLVAFLIRRRWRKGPAEWVLGQLTGRGRG